MDQAKLLENYRAADKRLREAWEVEADLERILRTAKRNLLDGTGGTPDEARKSYATACEEWKKHREGELQRAEAEHAAIEKELCDYPR